MAKDADSDSEENEQIRRSGRQGKRAKNAPQPQVYSSSEDEGSDVDYSASKTGQVKKKSASSSQKKVDKKKRPAKGNNEASEEGEVGSSSESDSGSSSDSSDSSQSTDNDVDTTNEMSRLVTDEEDKKRLMSMTEREREEELFQRLQRKTMIEKRRELERKLKQKTSNHASSADDKNGASSASYRRSSPRKDKVTTGLEDLKSERKARKDKEAKRHADARKRKGRDANSSDAESGTKSAKRERVHARDVYGSDDDDANVDIDGVIGLKPMLKNRVTSGDTDEMGGGDATRGGAGTGDGDENTTHAIKLEELKSAQVFRRELTEWLYAPFLRKFLIGVYVRINVGTHPDRNEPVYRIGQIEDIVEAADRTYEIEGQRTNKYLKLKLGARSREFRISYVSNCEITPEEFKMWIDVLHHYHLPVTTAKEIAACDQQLLEARAFKYEEDELNKMLDAKKAMNSNCLNPATGKAQLRLELQRLYDRGAPQVEVDAMLKQIRAIDDIICRREKNNSSANLIILGKVSQRNKFQNIETAMRLANPAAAAWADRQQQQLQNPHQQHHLQQQQRSFMPPPLYGANSKQPEPMDDDEGDPFTRRRTTPRMFLGAKAKSAINLAGAGPASPYAAGGIKQELMVDSKTETFLLPKIEQHQMPIGSVGVKIKIEDAADLLQPKHEEAESESMQAKFQLRDDDDARDVKPQIMTASKPFLSVGPRDEFLDLFDVEVGDLDII